ncbi:MAG: restriction endonuclease subunit S [Pusillimonas sp.]|nr:MAG: restriction endonuclease subunit S [Pusillimonas sp.]
MSDWIEAPLSQLVTFQKGRKVDTSAFAGEGFSAYLGASGIKDGDDGYAATQLAVIAKPTDTLMLWDGERSGLVGFGKQGVVASTVSKLSPNEHIEPKYLFFALSDRFGWIQHRRTGTGVPHVPKDLGRILKLRYPRTPTVQKKIASILTTTDSAIEKTEALIAKYQQIKTGLMHDLFTRGVLPNGQLRPPRSEAPELYQEAAIGWVPREWDVLPIGTILTRIDAGWSPECQEIPPGAGEWGILKVSAVTRGLYNPSESKSFPQEMVPDPTIEVTDGDVILTRANGVAELVGVTVQVRNTPTKLMLSDKLLRLVPEQEKMTKDFLALLMCSTSIKNQIDSVMSGSSGQRNISQSQIKNFCCIRPCLNEQQRIVTYIRAVEVNLERENLAKEKLTLQKLGLMQDLLTGKVPVSVDEPAPEAAHA